MRQSTRSKCNSNSCLIYGLISSITCFSNLPSSLAHVTLYEEQPFHKIKLFRKTLFFSQEIKWRKFIRFYERLRNVCTRLKSQCSNSKTHHVMPSMWKNYRVLIETEIQSGTETHEFFIHSEAETVLTN